MYNFIYFTDLHLRLSSPRRRTDDIFAAQVAKLEWIFKRAEELGSEAIICGGDFGDNWDWKISTANKIINLLKKAPCPVVTIIGNHDVPGRNPTQWEETGLGLLHNAGSIYILDSKDTGEHFNLAGLDVYAFHSDSKRTEDLINGKTIPTEQTKHLKVAIVHAPVGAETTPFCKGHKELFINDFDVALFGDIHPGWPVYESITGCKIANPGAATRLSKTDINRKPMVAVVYSNGHIDYEEIPHTPAKECFDLEGIQAERQELGKGFLAAIAARNAAGDLDPKSYVEKIGTEGGYSVKSIELLKEEL